MGRGVDKAGQNETGSKDLRVPGGRPVSLHLLLCRVQGRSLSAASSPGQPLGFLWRWSGAVKPELKRGTMDKSVEKSLPRNPEEAQGIPDPGPQVNRVVVIKTGNNLDSDTPPKSIPRPVDDAPKG